MVIYNEGLRFVKVEAEDQNLDSDPLWSSTPTAYYTLSNNENQTPIWNKIPTAPRPL